MRHMDARCPGINWLDNAKEAHRHCVGIVGIGFINGLPIGCGVMAVYECRWLTGRHSAEDHFKAT
jgi:hypothetical protein